MSAKTAPSLSYKGSNPKRLTAVSTVTNTPGNGTSGAAAASATSGNTENFDFSVNSGLMVWISLDGGTNYIKLPVADIGAAASDVSATTATEVVTALQNYPLINKYITPSVDTNAVKLTTKHLGATVKIYVTGDANTALGFTQVDDGTAASGSGDGSDIELTVQDPNGNSVPYAEVSGVLYDGASGTTKDTTATVQHEFSFSGGFTGGEFTNEFSAVTDQYGKLKFSVIDTASGAQDAFLSLKVNESDRYMDRLEVTTGTA